MYSINVTYTGATHAPARHFLLKERKKARLLAEAGGERWEQTDADFQWCGLQWWTPPTVTPTEFHSAHYPALFHEIRLRDGSTNPHRGNSDASLRWALHKALFEDHSTTGSFSTTSSVEKCINALQRPCYRSSNCLWIVSKNDRRGWTKSQIHALFDFAEHVLRSCSLNSLIWSHQSITAGPGCSWLTPWSWGWSPFGPVWGDGYVGLQPDMEAERKWASAEVACKALGTSERSHFIQLDYCSISNSHFI